MADRGRKVPLAGGIDPLGDDMYVRPDRDEIAARLGITDYTRCGPLPLAEPPPSVPASGAGAEPRRASSPAGPAGRAEPAVPAAPADVRCADCGYLLTAPGHRLTCGNSENQAPVPIVLSETST